MATIQTANVYASTAGAITFTDVEATQRRATVYQRGEIIGLSYLVKSVNSAGVTMLKVSLGGKAEIRSSASGRTETIIQPGRDDVWVKETDIVLETETKDLLRGGRPVESGANNTDNVNFLVPGVLGAGVAAGLYLKFFRKK